MVANRTNRCRRGLSFLELLIVVTIIGAIAAVVLPRIGNQAVDGKKRVCHQYRSDINTALEKYYFENSAFPSSVDALSPDYYPDAVPVCPITNEAYMIDSSNGRIKGHDHNDIGL